MYTQRTGLLKAKDSKRAVLMSQESKYEYENVARDADVTLYQFDQRKQNTDL